MAGPITERSVIASGIRVRLREVPGSGSPAVFVHGNPTSSADWLPFLERMRGPAIALDLPGFGRSERPDTDRFDHSLGAYSRLLADLLGRLAPTGYSLVVHDWGVVALAAALRDPAAVERLVVVNAVPLSDTYRWHWLARIWRRRGLGEALNAVNTRAATSLLLRLARPGRRPMPADFVNAVWGDWDAGMRRAILGLYRSADPAALAAAGQGLERLTCPALVAWGVADPYISVAQGRRYAARLPAAELLELAGAGHWPWIDRPELVERVVDFLEPAA